MNNISWTPQIEQAFEELKKYPSWIALDDTLIKSFNEELSWRLEYILRYCVNPPIKGEITKGKLRWRGITYSISYPTSEASESKINVHYNLTVFQRGVPVHYDELQFQTWKCFKIGLMQTALFGSTKDNGNGILDQIK